MVSAGMSPAVYLIVRLMQTTATACRERLSWKPDSVPLSSVEHWVKADDNGFSFRWEKCSDIPLCQVLIKRPFIHEYLKEI